MKRQMLVFVLISTVLLAACGGAPAPATNQPTAAPAAAAATAAPAAGEATAPAAAGEATAAPAAGGDATAVALAATEQAGIVSKPEEGKENVTWWTHNNPAFVAANK